MTQTTAIITEETEFKADVYIAAAIALEEIKGYAPCHELIEAYIRMNDLDK